jgi:hypothetical protein
MTRIGGTYPPSAFAGPDPLALLLPRITREVVIVTAARPLGDPAFAEAYAAEDAVLQAARNLAGELGRTPVSPAVLPTAAGLLAAVKKTGT